MGDSGGKRNVGALVIELKGGRSQYWKAVSASLHSVFSN